MNIVELEQPDGVIVQFGGQTPLNLAMRLYEAGVPIIGTSPESIDLAEDRKRFGKLLVEMNIPQPVNGTAVSFEEARRVAASIGYPVLVRPSYVLGGRAMMIVYDEASLEGYMKNAVEASPEKPVLIDQAKIAIMVASLIAGVAGLFFLKAILPKKRLTSDQESLHEAR